MDANGRNWEEAVNQIRNSKLVIILWLFLMAPALRAQTSPPAEKQTLYYIPHTHWEGAVFKTREDYLAMGLPNILQALRLLQEHPEYKFALDQVAYFKPFLELYPEEAAAFRNFIKEGRLEIVGGMDVMPDDVKPGGELFVRQMIYGKRYCREQLGVDVKVAWLLDTFGHHAQMPQLLRQAGFSSFWFCRGVPHNALPSEFFWRGIDGTEIPAFWLPGFYGLFYGPPRQFPEFSNFFRKRFDSLTKHARGFERVGLAGVDVSEPEDYVPALIGQFNQRPDETFKIRYSVPSEFAAVVSRRADHTVVTNDFNPIFQGTYSSRIELKQATRRIEQLLLTAEKLGALVAWLDPASQPTDEMLWRAWEPVLFNQTHDLASGVMTDVVYEDTVRSYDFSERLARELIESRWQSVAAQIDTRGDGVPIAVFNPLGWTRSDVAEIEIGITQPGVQEFKLVDSSGETIPCEVLRADHYAEGGLKRARLIFVARAVPALGYAVYHVIPQKSPADSNHIETGARDAIENEFYKLRFNLAAGEITSLFDKSLGWEVLSGPGNVISREQDKGDLWELYRGLNGGSYIAMTNQQPVPKAGTALLSSEFSGKTPGSIRRGPVLSEFSLAHPFANGSFATRVRLYQGLPRIDIQTELVNHEKYVRYQALFPISIHEGRSVQEIPFGSIERSPGVEFPAQHWVDYTDGTRGVALLNIGLPGNLATEGTLVLSLMRSHNLGAYGFGGGYEPGMSSETGFELGKRLKFDYALAPHAGDWRDGSVYRAGLEFNHPLFVRKVASHAGKLPKKWGLLDISPGNVVMTAFKPGPGHAAIIRVYEAAGRETRGAKVKLNAKITAAHEANLLEDRGAKISVKENAVRFDLHPYEIKTIAFELGKN